MYVQLLHICIQIYVCIYMRIHVYISPSTQGTMLKVLQSKSNANITLDQMLQADGTKRVCIDGTKLAVDIGFKSIQEMVNLCDDAKYEAVTRQRQTDEQSKKQDEDDSVRRYKSERQASDTAKKEAVRREAEGEAKRIADEKKWQERQQKAVKDAEEKKKLQVCAGGRGVGGRHGVLLLLV